MQSSTASPTRFCYTHLPHPMLERMTYASQITRGSSRSCIRQALLRCDGSLCAQGRHHERHGICRNQTRPLSPASTSPYSYKLRTSWLRRRALVLAINRAGRPNACLSCELGVPPALVNRCFNWQKCMNCTSCTLPSPTMYSAEH